MKQRQSPKTHQTLNKKQSRMKHLSTDSPYNEFIEGFAKEAPILIICEAQKEWDDFSQQLQLSIEEIVALEDRGYEAGIEMGKCYRRRHPLQRMD